MPSGGLRPQRLTSDVIVTAALELAASNGVEATSYGDVAAALGVSKAAIYHHFSSKDVLLDAMLRSWTDGLDRILDAAARDRMAPADVLSAYLDLLLEEPKAARLVVEDLGVINHHTHGRALEQRHQQLRAVIAPGPDPGAAVRAAAAVGAIRRVATLLTGDEVKDVRPAVISAALAALADGAQQEIPPRRATFTFPPDPQVAQIARKAVADALTSWGHHAGSLDVVVWLTNELVSNSLTHAGTVLTVAMYEHGATLRVGVTDQEAELPSLRATAPLATRGRGLTVVDALASRWGVDKHGASKTVWFELEPQP
jgi:AcrR family transcriptional regulator